MWVTYIKKIRVRTNLIRPTKGSLATDLFSNKDSITVDGTQERMSVGSKKKISVSCNYKLSTYDRAVDPIKYQPLPQN